MRKTIKNKIYAVIFAAIGAISLPVLEGDATVCALMLLFAVTLFFAKENMID